MEEKQTPGDTSQLSFLYDDNLRDSSASFRHQQVSRMPAFTEEDMMTSHMTLKKKEREYAGYQAGKKKLESILMKVTKDELQNEGIEDDGSLPGYLNMITTNESSSSSTKSNSGLVGAALMSLKQGTKLEDQRFGSWSKELEDVKEAKEEQSKEDEGLLLQLEPLDIVDEIERKQIVPPEQLQRPHSLLSDTRKHFSGSHKLVKRIHYPKIASWLYNPGDKNTFGTPTCIGKFKNLIMVGTSWGSIRVFSDNMQYQSLKLKASDKTIPAHSGERMSSVSALDVHYKGDYLLAGYGSGLVVLWSLKNNKPAEYVKDIFYERITTLRFYSKQHLSAVVADLSGRIFILDFKKGFTGFSMSRKRLIQNQKSAFFQVAPLWPHRNYPSHIDQYTTLGLAAVDSVSIVTIEPIARGMYTKILPRNNSGILHVPYLSWGRGCTPSDLQNQLPVLAFSYDKVIRLVKVSLQEGSKGGCVDDGYYISNFEIQNLVWLGESLIGALIKKAEIRVLYTGAFQKGYYKDQVVNKSFAEDEEEEGSLTSIFKIDLNYDRAMSYHLSNTEDEAPFLDSWSVTVHGPTGKESETNVIEYQTYQDKIVSLHETVREIEEGAFLIMGESAISEVQLFEWTQFIELLKNDSGWLNALSMALEIYSGNRKGFIDVPQQKRFREASLRGVMKDYIRAFIETCITGVDYDLSYKNLIQSKSTRVAQFPDDIIARVAIEYCLSINEPGYLFSDLLKRFTDNQKENVLIKALEPFIIGQQLKDIPLNEQFVNMLLEYYTKPVGKEESEQEHVLEYILMSLYLEEADAAILETILQKLEKMEMFRPILYILTNTEPKDEEIKYLRSKHLTNLLTLLFESLKINTTLVADVGVLRDHAQMRNKRLSRTDDRQATYEGYRLFWVLQKYLNLQKFPHGRMSSINFELCCQTSMLWLFGSGISNLLSKDQQIIAPGSQEVALSQDKSKSMDHLDRLLSFSPELTFQILVQFFEPDIVNAIQMLSPYKKLFSLDRIFELILKKCNALNLQNKFFTFFLPSIVRHKTDFTVSRDICLNGIKNLLQNYHESTLSLAESEEDILALLEYKETKTLSDQELTTLIQMANITPFIKMRLMLCDLKEDYVKGLEISLGHERVKDKLFAWLDQVLTKLKREDPGGEKKQQLDRKILESLRELVKLDTEQTVRLIDKWFSEWHQKVIDRLESVPELQLRYLEDFLSRKEDHISMLNGRIKDESSELKNFQRYLIRFVELLCRFEPKRVLHFVKKPYYSTKECLEVVIKYEVHDAAAMLFKKTGQFEESVGEYLMFMQQLLPGLIGGMIQRVFQEGRFGEKGTPDQRVYIECQERFAHALTKIAKICLQEKDDDIAPDLWFKALSGVFRMKELCRHWLGFTEQEGIQEEQLVTANRSINVANQSSFIRPRSKRRNVVANAMVDEMVLVGAFFQNKIQWLIERMSTTVKLPIILKTIISRLAHLPYKEFKLLIENMLTSYFQQENIMNAANELLRRDIGDQTQKYLSANRKGCVVFGPPRVTASVQRGNGQVSLHKKKGTDFIIWDSKSIDKGFGESLVLSMNQQKVV